jgi:hypothetical protein
MTIIIDARELGKHFPFGNPKGGTHGRTNGPEPLMLTNIKL